MKLKFTQPIHWVQVDGERSHHRFAQSYAPPVTEVDLSSLRGALRDREPVLIQARGAQRFTRRLRHPWIPGTVAHISLLRSSGLWAAAPLAVKGGLILTTFGAIVGGVALITVAESKIS